MYYTPYGFRYEEAPQIGHQIYTDIQKVGGDYLIEADLPGFVKGEIRLHLKDGYLTIEAEHEKEQDSQRKVLHRERPVGGLRRTFHVSKYLKEEDIRAKYENGVLTIRFPQEVQRTVEEKKAIPIQ